MVRIRVEDKKLIIVLMHDGSIEPYEQPGYFPSIEQIAEKLSMTSRTLRRKLSDEDASFSQIIDDIRCELALDYLTNSELLIEEIAELLGYSSAENFSHAFRRWKGCSPKSFRVSSKL